MLRARYGSVALLKLGKKSIERSALLVALSLVFLTLLMMQLLIVTFKEIAQSPIIIIAMVFFVILLILGAFALRTTLFARTPGRQLQDLAQEKEDKNHFCQDGGRISKR